MEFSRPGHREAIATPGLGEEGPWEFVNRVFTSPTVKQNQELLSRSTAVSRPKLLSG